MTAHPEEKVPRGAGSIARRNGAWLVALSDPEGDLTPDALYDCASSQDAARRIARRMAEGMGYVGPFHWRKHEGSGSDLYWLDGYWIEPAWETFDHSGSDEVTA